MLPGIYNNLDIKVYHADQAISSTGINLILDCPARFHYERVQKYLELDENEIIKQEEKYKLGRAVHMLVLEPDKFNNTFYCMKEYVNLTTKAGKEIYADAQKEAKGRTILRVGEWEHIKTMTDEVLKHSVWKSFNNIFIEGSIGYVEHSIFWGNSNNQASLKARPDIFNDALIIDLKTTDSIKNFERSIHSYGYYRQAAMQIDGLIQSDKIKRNFGFFVVESKAPYLTACFKLDNESIEQGRREYLEAAALYQQCLKHNEWPGYSDRWQLASLPRWAITDNDLNLEPRLAMAI